MTDKPERVAPRNPAAAVAPAAPSTADGLRRENLGRILRLIHTHGTLTRSRVTHLTGLSRTAVGALLGELVEGGLVAQGDPLPSERAGRPSASYGAQRHLLGVAVNADVKGVRIGFSNLDGTVRISQMIPRAKAPTPQAVADVISTFVDNHMASNPDDRVVGIGVAVPGRVDPAGRVVTVAPYLRWEQEPVADTIEAATGLPTLLGYDAELAVVTEAMWGAARGTSNTTYIYGGPGGIGGSAVCSDQVLVGANNLASRLAHLTVDPEGPECRCGSRGCFEPTVSFRNYESALSGDLAGFTDFAAALRRTRSSEVGRLLDRDAELLGRVLRTVVLVYDPEMIMLGGFLAGVLEQRRGALEEAARGAALTRVARPPVLQPSQFGADQLLVGAGALAFRRLLDDPAPYISSTERGW